MRKFLLATTILATLSSASAAQKIGAYLFGVQFERDTTATDSTRLGLGLPLAVAVDGVSMIGVSGDYSWLRHTAPARQDVQPYYGFGLGLSAAFGGSGDVSVAAFSMYPNVLGGLNFNLDSRLSLFTELSVGPRVTTAYATDSQGNSASETRFERGYGLRLGVNYTLR